MCKFCEDNKSIDTTIGDYDLTLLLDADNRDFLEIAINVNNIGITRPIKINYCPFCGDNLKEKS